MAWIALALVVAIGTALRGLQYLSGRALWHDEALLALNLVDRPLAHVVGRLDFGQAAPWPFVLLEWGIVRALGPSEESVRLLPLAAGIASLVLFAVLARRLLAPAAAVAATLAFALANGAVYYAAELKPYSSDVLATCVILLVGACALDPELTRRRAAFLGAAAAAAIVFSYPSLFVAGPVLGVLLIAVPRRENWRRTVACRAPAIAIAALAILILIVDAHTRTGEVRDAFQGDPGAFATASDDGGSGLIDLGFVDRFGSALIQALGLAQERPLSHLAKIVAVVAAVGFLSLLRRRPAVAAMVGLPFAATLFASTLDIYPITERTTLFLVPCVALLLGEGIWWPARRWRGRGGLALAALAAATAVAFPAYSAAYHVIHPRKKEELRALLAAVGTAWEPGDTLILHPPTQYAFRYYAECGCLDERGRQLVATLRFVPRHGPSSISPALKPANRALVLAPATRDASVVRANLARIHGRLWFVFSHANSYEEGSFLDQGVPDVLDDLGTRLDILRRRGATAYVYDLP